MVSIDSRSLAKDPLLWNSTDVTEEDSNAGKGAGLMEPPCHSNLPKGIRRRWEGNRGRAWRSTFAVKPRHVRRYILRNPWMSPVAAHILAALQASSRQSEHNACHL
ncbi:unnamed protein product [Choristocarpus tenellus]